MAVLEEKYYTITGDKGWAEGWIRNHTGNAILHIGKDADAINRTLGATASVPWRRDVYLPADFGEYTFFHELAHVMDNNQASAKRAPATYAGGGAADAMVSAMGGHPEMCFPRFRCLGMTKCICQTKNRPL